MRVSPQVMFPIIAPRRQNKDAPIYSWSLKKGMGVKKLNHEKTLFTIGINKIKWNYRKNKLSSGEITPSKSWLHVWGSLKPLRYQSWDQGGADRLRGGSWVRSRAAPKRQGWDVPVAGKPGKVMFLHFSEGTTNPGVFHQGSDIRKCHQGAGDDVQGQLATRKGFWLAMYTRPQGAESRLLLG